MDGRPGETALRRVPFSGAQSQGQYLTQLANLSDLPGRRDSRVDESGHSLENAGAFDARRRYHASANQGLANITLHLDHRSAFRSYGAWRRTQASRGGYRAVTRR